jgi:acyl dehydratase
MSKLMRYGASVGKIFGKQIRGGAKKNNSNSLILPNVTAVEKGISLDAAHVKEYGDICGSDGVHLMYPAMISAPLQMEVMASDEFPLPVLGLVHLANRIQQFDHITTDMKLNIEVKLGEKITLHKKGYVADIIADVYCDSTGDLVWKSECTLFSFNERDASSDKKEDLYQSQIKQKDMDGMEEQERWEMAGNMGRRYAAVSGDYNPIHLSAISASLFGFQKGAILHGMWTKARSVSALMPSTHMLSRPPPGPPGSSSPAPMAEMYAEFKTPLILPSTVTLSARSGDIDSNSNSSESKGTDSSRGRGGKGYVFEVKGAGGDMLPHMRGVCSWHN